jgi:hypothetical protein
LKQPCPAVREPQGLSASEIVFAARFSAMSPRGVFPLTHHSLHKSRTLSFNMARCCGNLGSRGCTITSPPPEPERSSGAEKTRGNTVPAGVTIVGTKTEGALASKKITPLKSSFTPNRLLKNWARSRRLVLASRSRNRGGVDAVAHRRRRVTQRCDASASGPSGSGGGRPSSALLLLPDAHRHRVVVAP